MKINLIAFAVCWILTLLAGGVDASEGPATKPHRVLWMRHTGGWGAGVLAEFSLNADGRFEWYTRTPGLRGASEEKTRWAGKLPAEAMRQLITQIADAGDGAAAEDAGVVEFTWVGADGGEAQRMYTTPRQAPCKGLLDKIEKLVAAHGAKLPDDAQLR